MLLGLNKVWNRAAQIAFSFRLLSQGDPMRFGVRDHSAPKSPNLQQIVAPNIICVEYGDKERSHSALKNQPKSPIEYEDC
jgi:hypothetical protein